MKSRLSTIFYMLAPCIVLAGFAFYLSRVPSPTPKATRDYGPFQLRVAGVETQPIKPIDVFQGYDRRFQIVFDAQGTRPKWWGNDLGGRSGKAIKGWMFWLEKEGKRRSFQPGKTDLWTSDYDKSKARYTNEFSLHSGDVPTDWALKARGTTYLGDMKKHLSANLPFEFTLKKAGEKWQGLPVSTDPGAVVRSIKITRSDPGHYSADIQIFAPHMENNKSVYLGQSGWRDANWREFHHLQVAKGPYHGFYTDIFHSFGSGSSDVPMTVNRNSERLQTCYIQWDALEMHGEPRRDVIAVALIAYNDHWPLEIAFYAKRNGKVPLGEVKALTRPRQTKTPPST